MNGFQQSCTTFLTWCFSAFTCAFVSSGSMSFRQNEKLSMPIFPQTPYSQAVLRYFSDFIRLFQRFSVTLLLKLKNRTVWKLLVKIKSPACSKRS